ncbi:hypothetical protein Tco_1398726 [Tanacetum coccineum]
MGKIKDINALSNLYAILSNEGFDDVKLSYLGGFWVLIDTGSTSAKEKLIKHVGVRLIWISEEGLLMCTWNINAFSKIVSPWGTLSDVDDVILNKKEDKATTKSDDLTFPLGFTPNDVKDKVEEDIANRDRISSTLIDEASIVGSDRELGGYRTNYEVQYGKVPSVGFSRGILCVWDPNVFAKDNVTILDSFVAVPEAYIVKVAQGLQNSRDGPVRWSIEGDENSKYFHGIINMKRSQLAIRGVLVEGDWINESSKVKNEFLNHFSNHFSNRFSIPSGPNINIDTHMFKQISFDQNEDLESDVTYDEIKRAVWDCGTNKSPRPDGFTFDFIRR